MRQLPARYPQKVIEALVQVAAGRSTEVYLVGGTVRDWLLGRPSGDLDLTVSSGGIGFCRDLIRELGGGAFVRLGSPEEDAARVVWKGQEIDVSVFRGGSSCLADDLALRDYSINTMAVSLSSLVSGEQEVEFIDPLGGQADLAGGLLRCCPGAFMDDPLRMLRGYRLMATLGFVLEPETEREIRKHAPEIGRVAAERIRYELDLVMASKRGCATMWAIHESGLLRQVLPELYEGEGVDQPDFHHLDVFRHNFQALEELEQLLAAPEKVYPDGTGMLKAYLDEPHVVRCLKWAGLLHDIGKPAARRVRVSGERRVTFYGHDESGRELFDRFARRLKWSNEDRERTGALIGMHMHPFHLCNVRQEDQLTRRAALKLCRKAGEHLHGLFLLAMADSLASRGEMKPVDMEGQLISLYQEVIAIYEEHIRPALSGPRLLGGNDLVSELNLVPGPIFSEILDELEAAQVEGQVTTRDQALAWVAGYLEKRSDEASSTSSRKF